MGEVSRTTAVNPRALYILYGIEVLWVAYGAYSYSGPYRWAAELSMHLFGAYQPRIAFLTALLPLLIATTLSFRLLGGRLPAAVPVAQHSRRSELLAARILRLKPWLMVAVPGAVLFFVGGRDVLAARAGATLTPISCAWLEAGNVPTSTWLEIEGSTLQDAAVTTKESHTQYTYVPLVSGAWSKDKPLAVLLRFELDRPRNLDSTSFQGSVSREGVPGMVRVEYEAAGAHVENALVLVVGRVPHDSLLRSQIIAAAGLAALLLAGLMIRRKWTDASN